MLERTHYETREQWLAGRKVGLGASEAAAAIGQSPWQTPLELWKLKTGQMPPKDLSGNPAVMQGVMWEPILRDLFIATHPEYTVEHYPYDILFQRERPWMFATLDGELCDDEKGMHGILEIKTATPNGKIGWEKWSGGNLPDNYYIQTLHQLLATGFDFVRLFACLFSLDGSYTIKTYEIERQDVEEDLAWLLNEETTFWDYVKRGVMPPQRLIL